MKLTWLFCLCGFLLFHPPTYGQKGKDGVKVVNTVGTLVNDYTYLTANASAGSSAITVSNSAINALALFAGNLSAGDLIMIIQIQGATISSSPNDSTWGTVTAYNNCGLNEFRQVQSVPNGTTINLTCPLANNYTATGNVEVVRIPRYVSLTINSGGSVTCYPWDGQTGGIVAIEVEFNTIVNGNISASWMGFRGGVASNSTFTYGVTTYFSANHNMGAEKGEGIAGFEAGYTIYGGEYCRGAAANGGGGANSVNAGGGGGANAGNITGYNGNGNPDVSNPAWIAAWNLEYPGFATNVSSGGGRGGYAWGNCGPNPYTTAPGNPVWLGDNRNNHGGKGGRPLDYSTGRLFLGGGGGAGDENNGSGSSGAPGGGLIYIINYGTISGTDSIVSNGENALPALFNGVAEDGGGGGGGGGTIILNSTGTISGIIASAMGGKGADQIELTDPYNDVEGTAGGGGGGYIAISNGVITELVTGGKCGGTTWPCMSTFPQDGATLGGPGQVTTLPGNNAAITVNDTVLCKGDSVHFSGSANFGGPYTWSWSFPGGTPSSSSLQNPAITYSSSGTYTVKLIVTSCISADTLTKNVNITLTSIAVTLTGLDSICPGQTDSIKANGVGATSYTWTGGVTCPSCAATSANPLVTTTYSLTVSNGTCMMDTTFTVNVKPLPLPVITAKPDTICSGDSVKLTGSGGGTYFWPVPGTSNNPVWVKPVTTTTYTLQVTKSGCMASVTKQVFVGAGGIANLILRNDSICPSDSTYLVASGGITYKWSPGGATTDSIKVKPGVSTTYTVIVLTSCGIDTLSKTLHIVPLPVIGTSGDTVICLGSNTNISASGGISYKWSPGGSTNSTINVSPSSTTTYTVAVSNSKCAKDTTITVKVLPLPAPTISAIPDTICAGSNTTLYAGGGTKYTWSTGATTTSINVSPSSTKTYTVTVSNGKCSKDTNITVTVGTPAVLTITPNQTLCIGDSTVLTATGGPSYKWSNGATTASIMVKPASTTSYTCVVTKNGCVDSISTTVTVDVLTLTACCDKTILIGGADTIIAGLGSNYLWSPDAGLNCDTCATVIATPTVTTTYTVTTKDAHGCTLSRMIVVYVETPCADFTVPNIFTPNNDGRNDDFVINILNPSSYSIIIYDRWGKEVYTSTDPTVYWNGLMMKTQSLVSDGVYYYIIKATCGDNTYNKKGFVQVIGGEN